jgi:homoserine O-acetyltransferase
MDSHQLARGRGKGLDEILHSIRQKTLVVGIGSDILCPVEEQRHIAMHMPDAELTEIDSAYGHDGFMVEGEKITRRLSAWLSVD